MHTRDLGRREQLSKEIHSHQYHPPLAAAALEDSALIPSFDLFPHLGDGHVHILSLTEGGSQRKKQSDSSEGHSSHAWLLFLVPFVHQNILGSFSTVQLVAQCLNQGEAGNLYYF